MDNTNNYHTERKRGGWCVWDENGNSAFFPDEDDSATLISDAYGVRWERAE